VEQLLDQEATGTSSGSQYFWSDRPNARILARMLDRTWRAGILLEGCRKTLSQVYRVMFPHNEQLQGIPALLDRFREGSAIKEMIHTQLVAGANVALAYLRKHRPHLPLVRILQGLPEEEHYAEALAPARQLIHQVQNRTEKLVGPLDAPKGEPAE